MLERRANAAPTMRRLPQDVYGESRAQLIGYFRTSVGTLKQLNTNEDKTLDSEAAARHEQAQIARGLGQRRPVTDQSSSRGTVGYKYKGNTAQVTFHRLSQIRLNKIDVVEPLLFSPSAPTSITAQQFGLSIIKDSHKNSLWAFRLLS